MKKYLFLLFFIASTAHAQVITFPNRGGTGTSSIPTIGQVLVGQSNGTYGPQATSTLGITGGGGSGNSAFTIGNGFIYNATTSDKVGIGSTSPTATFSIQGSTTAPTRNLFDVASSTGSNFFTILSSGNVGVGTTTPSSRLDVSGNFKVATSATSTFFVDTANQKIGIGTNAPTETLTIKNVSQPRLTFGPGSGSNDTAAINIRSRGTGSQTISFTTDSVADRYYIGYYQPTSQLQFGLGAVPNTTVKMIMDSVGFVAIGSTTAQSVLTIKGTGTTDPFNIASSTNEGLFIVKANGNIGIGSSTPAFKLSVNGGVNAGLFTGTSSTATSTFANASTTNFAVTNILSGSGAWTTTGAIQGATLRTSQLGIETIPTFSFSADTNTGMYKNGAGDINRLGFSTNGIGTLFIDENQNVGVSTTSPSARFTVNGTTSSPTVDLFNVASSTFSSFFKIDSFGTTTIANLTASNCDVLATVTGSLFCGTNGSGSGNSAWTIGNGLIYNATSTDTVAIGSTTAIATLNVKGKGGTNPFTVASSTGSVLFTVTQAGNVGVGTSTPTSPLHIYSAADAPTQVLIENISPSGVLADTFFQLKTRSSNFNFLANDDANEFYIIDNNGGSFPGSSRFQIDSSGRVGVGMNGSSMAARLHAISTTEQLRLGYDGSNYFSTTIGSTGGVTFNAVGSGSLFTFSDAIVNTLPIRLKGYTVATLPAGTVGDTAYVTDATLPTYNGALTGGGAVVVPVFYNGSAWTSH